MFQQTLLGFTGIFGGFALLTKLRDSLAADALNTRQIVERRVIRMVSLHLQQCKALVAGLKVEAIRCESLL